MRRTRRVGGLAAAVVAAVSLIGGPALAQSEDPPPAIIPGGPGETTTTTAAGGAEAGTGTETETPGSPETFATAAGSEGFDLTVGGTSVSFGRAEAQLESAPKASARGVGQLTGDTGTPDATAEATADGQSQDKPETCITPALPTEMIGVAVDLACSSATAKVVGGKPTASSTGRVSEITLAANNVLTALPVTAPIRAALDQVLGALPAGVGMPVSDLIDDVIENETLTVRAGPVTAAVVTDDAKATATATSSGVVVELFPTGAVGGGPLVVIEVGDATATATYDRKAGKAAGESTGRVVTVRFAEELATSLRLPEREIAISAVDTTCLPLPDPLTSCITIGGGQVVTDDKGVVTAFAAGVSLDLLKGLQGGIQLELAAAAASAGGTAKVEAVTTTTTTTTAAPEVLAEVITPPVPPGELPRTGGTPALPLAGGLLLAVAVVVGLVAVSSRRERAATTTAGH